MSSIELRGSLSTSLGLLTSLQELLLGSCILGGAIPPAIGQLINLRLLYLHDNSFTGSLPSSLGLLTSLQTLFVTWNQLSGPIPPAIGQLIKLQFLDLGYNALSGSIPAELSALTGLTSFSLGRNSLSGTLPTFLTTLSNVRTLFLNANSFTGTVPSFNSLTSLQNLDLRDNYLSGVVTASQHPNLCRFAGRLGSNCFAVAYCSRSVPAMRSASECAAACTQQNTCSNPMGEFIRWARGCPSEINSSSCTSMAGVRTLVSLNGQALGFNNFQNSISEDISTLASLTYLKLVGCQLAGSLPSSLGLLTSLQSLRLSTNKLSGPIPPAIGQLIKLQSLDLGENALSGSFPAELSALSGLTDLNLGGNSMAHNNLTGTIPAFLATFNFQQLYLEFNSFTGTVPSFFSSLTGLQSLALHHNYLSGVFIASQQSNLCRFASELGSNCFAVAYCNGSVPAMRSASECAAACTQQSTCSNQMGEFIQLVRGCPSEIDATSCTSSVAGVRTLVSLNAASLGFNNFLHSIPDTITTLSSLSVLSLASCNLGGTLPPSLLKLAKLIQLDLGYNALNGSIPNTLGSLGRLTSLVLRSNRLTGSIPTALGTLGSVELLSLRRNLLIGQIPSTLGLLPYLNELYLDNNLLTGATPSFPQSSTIFFDLSYNFITSVSGCTIYGAANALRGNCLFVNDCGYKPQRNLLACTQFCNTVALAGPCGGLGTCTLSSSNSLPTCICDPPYITNPTDPGSCTSNNSSGGGGPPPAKYPQGVSYSTPTPFQFLGRYSRYLSARFSMQNSVPSWDIQSTSAWMGPRELFIGYDPSLPQDAAGVLTWGPARDQGNCSSCWALSSADAVAAAATIAASRGGGAVAALSAQQLLNCSSNSSSGGCQGDFPTNALDYAVQVPLLPEAGDSSSLVCDSIQGQGLPQAVMYESVLFRGWFGLLLTVQLQPAIIILDGSSSAFQNPACQLKNFVLLDPSCNTGSLNHGVLVVGYDLTALSPYWLVRNSWGPDWCNNGSMRLGIQGGDGTCGMNVLPAYYPVPTPALGDPCYQSSTVPNGKALPALNPCGGGTCSRQPSWGAYSYTCDCTGLWGAFVAVNNTVNVSLPGAELGITQACVPVDACGLALTNPCEVGTCVNDRRGGYTCICPLGYSLTSYVYGGQACSYGVAPGESTTYIAQPAVSCALIAAAYQLPLSQLKAQNPGLDCAVNPLREGVAVNISNSLYSCSIAYMVTKADRTCSDVAQQINLTTLTKESLAALNPSTDCSSLFPGQSLCLASGPWQAPCLCTRNYMLRFDDTCARLVARAELASPLDFFALNPGFNCNGLSDVSLAKSIGQQGTAVCLGRGDPIGTVNCQANGYLSYSLRSGDTCDNLWRRLNFKDKKQLVDINRPLNGFRCDNAKAGQVICYPKPAS